MELFKKLVPDIKSKGPFNLSKPMISMASNKWPGKKTILAMMFRVLHVIEPIWLNVYLFLCFKI